MPFSVGFPGRTKSSCTPFRQARSSRAFNVLEIAARHPSLQRYLGVKSAGFPGQDKQHFRVLVAEIVADAVCSKIVEKREAVGSYDDENTDWNFFYAEYSKLMTEFLPLAHSLQVQPREV